MGILEFITKLCDILAWPILIITIVWYVFRNYSTFCKLWSSLWKPLRGVHVEFYGQKLELSQKDAENAMENIDTIVDQMVLNEAILQAVPYVGYQNIATIVTTFTVLESLGLNLERIDKPNILACFGGYYYIKNDFSTAARFYNLALRRADENQCTSEVISNIKNCMGWCHRGVANFPEALKFFATAIKDDDTNPWPHLGISLTYSDLLAALDETKGVLEYQKERDEHLYKAQILFKNKIEQCRTDYISYSGLARVYQQMKEYEDAIQHLNVAIAIKNDFAMGYYNRAICKIMKKSNIANSSEKNVDGARDLEALYVDAAQDLVSAVLSNPTLKEYVAQDRDFESLRETRCYKCIMKFGP